jgi:hypothetical protein
MGHKRVLAPGTYPRLALGRSTLAFVGSVCDNAINVVTKPAWFIKHHRRIDMQLALLWGRP